MEKIDWATPLGVNGGYSLFSTCLYGLTLLKIRPNLART
jgi:hypothetical protein